MIKMSSESGALKEKRRLEILFSVYGVLREKGATVEEVERLKKDMNLFIPDNMIIKKTDNMESALKQAEEYEEERSKKWQEE